ncbi:hypothetical protein LCGC14_1779660 [marine sediment metagenome]|uniref:Uncharacterized protein n=1 Tax=marine sediment metagenome TaxID=412755 RepID=A0A0F9HIF2_9ZZZZ
MSDQRMQPARVVIERRGDESIEWSTEDGLRGISMAPFGVIGEFEGKEVRQQMVSWYEISKFTIYDLDFRSEESGAVQICNRCTGTGLVDRGAERCPDCDGFGHVRPS